MSLLTFTPHPKQQAVLDNAARFQVICAGRRGGKSALQTMRLVNAALSFPLVMRGHTFASDKFPVVLGVMPTLQMAKVILWRPLVKLLEDHPLVESINRSDYIITFRGPRPPIIIRGANNNNGDGLRGLRIYHLGLDEVQDVSREAIDMVLFPALADTPGSTALLSGTPKGRANVLYELYQRGQELPGWASHTFHTIDNLCIPGITEEVERARKFLPARTFRQEFQASFENFDGMVFSEFDRDVHVVNQWPNDVKRFWIGYDPGVVNPAAVLIAEEGEYERFTVVDSKLFGDGTNPVLSETVDDHILRWCQQYPVRGVMVDPSRNDLRVQLQRKINAAGLKVKAIQGHNAISPGCDTINALLHQKRLFIHSSLSGYIDRFASYHRAKDKDGNITDKIADGQNDHENDSTRYCLYSLNVQLKGKLLGLAALP